MLANVPQLSRGFEEGRADAKSEWAIARKEDGIHNLQTKHLMPEVGKSYQGPIVDADGDGDKVFQSVKHEGLSALVVHQLKDLSSTKADTFAPSGKLIDIRYAAQGVAVGKEVKELGGPMLVTCTERLGWELPIEVQDQKESKGSFFGALKQAGLSDVSRLRS